MYRVLAEADEVRERRDQVRHPAYVKPELVATAPNQVWSWDITKLKGPVPYLYYALYVILDLFSRYVVGWMVAVKESAHLAERLIEQTCAKQRIQPQQLTIHADRGAPMRSKLVALLFLRPRHRGQPLAATRRRSSTCVTASASWPTPRIRSDSSADHHAQKPCRPPYGSIRRRKRPARMPQDRRPAPRTTRSMRSLPGRDRRSTGRRCTASMASSRYSKC